MSRQPINPANLPYAPRRRSTRPERSLPDIPAGDDVVQTYIAEVNQHYTSPPSPPPASDALPPPPPPKASSAPSQQTPSSGAQTSAAHLHPYLSTLPISTALAPPTTLTPLRAHYLKKTLVNLQMSHELNLLTDPVLGANSLGLLGDPFVLPESAKREALERVSEIARAEGRLGDLPFMRFLFHQFLLPFPFLTTAPPTFWSAKVQPFLSNFLQSTGYTRQTSLSVEEQMMAESLMTPEEKKESDEKKRMWAKVEKHMGLMVGVGVKVVGGEEVVRIGQSELRRLEQIQEERKRRWQEKHAVGQHPGSAGGDNPHHMVFEVNVVGVRAVVEKGRVRSKSHEEFLIRTRRTGMPDVYVSRRYGDFNRLAEELRLAFPDSPIAPPPPKDRSTVASPPPQAQATGYSYYNPMRAFYGSGSPAQSGASTPPTAAGEEPASPTTPAAPATPLSREKNRMTLRAYLQGILSYPDYLNSPILRSFLLSSPITLTPAEAIDCQRRLEADAVREEGRRRFKEEAERRVDALRQGLAQFKGEVLSREGGLQKVFEVVRRVEKVEDLPTAEASVLEWGRISLAATIFQVFVASDTASETLASLKRLHGLMPYFVLKGILRISNPMAMIRGVLDLFLARPFGGQSLIQRMFSSSLTEDVRLLAEDIETVAEKVDDPVLCQKVEQFAKAPFEIQEIYRKDAAAEGLDLLVLILRSPDGPILARPQFQRVFRAARAYKEYKASMADLSDSDDDQGPESEDAWLFEDLNILLKLWLRKREKEQLLALIFEGVTAELLKDIITIFYAPLAQVYKAASIADSVGDLQNFLNDMIRTVEQVEELRQEDPQRTVQTFIDLVQRHEQAFYTFVHNVHSKGQGLFDSLMAWIELFLSYARDGIAQPIDLEFILPHAEEARAQIMAEVDAVAQYHYKLKVAHEEKIRRRFNKEGAPTDDEAALLGSVLESLSIGETTLGQAGELADDDSDEEDEMYSDEEDEEHNRSRRSSTSTYRDDRDGRGTPSKFVPLSTPETLKPDLPPLGASTTDGGSKKKDRRGSAASNRNSLDKIRSGLGARKSNETTRDEKQRSKEDKRPPPIKVDRPHGHHQHHGHGHAKKASRKARERAAREALKAPETPAINELRSLFVEALRPMLIVKPLKMLPPSQ